MKLFQYLSCLFDKDKSHGRKHSHQILASIKELIFVASLYSANPSSYTRLRHVDAFSRFREKPWPDLYEAASTRLGLDSSQCLVVEDATTGIVSARSAGCQVAALCGTFTTDKLFNAGADFIFQRYHSLRTFLDKKQ
jgi:HAD superfamily hydrolase (TIGR01509 family)